MPAAPTLERRASRSIGRFLTTRSIVQFLTTRSTVRLLTTRPSGSCRALERRLLTYA